VGSIAANSPKVGAGGIVLMVIPALDVYYRTAIGADPRVADIAQGPPILRGEGMVRGKCGPAENEDCGNTFQDEDSGRN
jgi:hypothetical protein